jgi:hypothetical protein
VAGSKIPAALAVLVVSGVLGYLAFAPKPVPPPDPVLTAEAKGYLGNLHLSEVAMGAADSYLKTSLVEITGKLTNGGSRTISLVQVNCVFRDVTGNVVKRERVTIAGLKTGPLPQGGTRSFQLNFDNIPETWNQTLPDLVIAQIQFA